MSFHKLALGAVVTLTSMLLAVPSALASTDSAAAARSPLEVVTSVLYADDQQSTFDALSDQEKAVFEAAIQEQVPVTVRSETGRFTPTAERLAKMSKGAPPAEIEAVAAGVAAAGCWYHYSFKKWYDLGFIEDGETWMQLNWCGDGTNVTSYDQTNVGCVGHLGFSCTPGVESELDVGWEVRSARYFNATWGPYHNTLCMLIRGGAGGLYSEYAAASGGCPLT